MKYELFFNDRWGNDHFVASYDSEPLEVYDKVIESINEFCAERGYKIPYMRVWEAYGRTKFDVGSHVEFFEVTPPIKKEAYGATDSSD